MNAKLLMSSILGSIHLVLTNVKGSAINPSSSSGSEVLRVTKYPKLASEAEKVKGLIEEDLKRIQSSISASTLTSSEKDRISLLYKKVETLSKMWSDLSVLLEEGEENFDSIKTKVLSIIELESAIIQQAATLNVQRYLTQDFLSHFEEYVKNHEGEGNLGEKIADFAGGSLLFGVSQKSSDGDKDKKSNPSE
ncbi:hypothetical protein PFJ87_05g01870 [Encephalitozoon hellem]|uniref:Uncharacterized protein n=1 Tax=Encephalitozoon hellem TaxID=27973 RepID=A0ABY8CM30_ENCHE|nr:hypothetical protein PFJ87_05g01870 [Encephalitozoon hellem]